MLQMIQGKPLIIWTLIATQKWEGVEVVVATDDERILHVVQGAGYQGMMTPSDLPSGTDRVAWVARKKNHGGAVVNWQGDEPALDWRAAEKATGLLDRFDIGTLCAPYQGRIENENRVKVQMSDRGEAIAFGRRPIAPPHWEHIGLYACRAAALEKWVSAPPTPNERRFNLEQLRAMELGLRIGVAPIPSAPVGVNERSDIDRLPSLAKL